MQVLGSGGPIPDDARASSSYLVWVDGRARVLVDAGGGLLPRFGASGARLRDLDAIAISHLHVDHVGGLASLLKGGYFSTRRRALPIVGPSGTALFPPIDEFLQTMLDRDEGMYRYLSDYLVGEQRFLLDPVVVQASSRTSREVFANGRVRIEAVGVRHGVIPALGFLISTASHRFAFMGDQSAAENQTFVDLIQGADVLIAHHAIPETGADGLRHLHSTPSELGQLAARAHVGRLVLSHHMRRSLEHLDQGLRAIRRAYSGPVDVADDLACVVPGPAAVGRQHGLR